MENNYCKELKEKENSASVCETKIETNKKNENKCMMYDKIVNKKEILTSISIVNGELKIETQKITIEK